MLAPTFYDMTQALPDAPEEFLRQAIEEGQTVLETQIEWAALQQQRCEALKALIAALEAESAEIRSQLTFARKARGQHPPLRERHGARSGVGFGGAAADQFRAMVSELVDSGMTRHQAHAQVMRDNPELRQQMIDESNAGHASRSDVRDGPFPHLANFRREYGR